MTQGIDWYDPADARIAKLQREALEKYGVDDLEDLPVNFDAIALIDSEAFGDRVYDRRWGELWAIYERQERLQSWAGLLAPALAVRGLSMGMAGTDLAQHLHFVDAAEAHRRRINLQLNEHMMRSGSDPSTWRELNPPGQRGSRYASSRRVAGPRRPPTSRTCCRGSYDPWRPTPVYRIPTTSWTSLPLL
ncbi:MAG: DUF3526 domain-containing protein [Thermoanaerobaculia bacterium]